MKDPLLPDLNEIIATSNNQELTSGNKVTKAVAIFDLTDSTKLKIESGHTAAKEATFRHNWICRTISRSFGGQVVKEMGDGIIVTFDEPEKACLAAVNIQRAMQLASLSSKGAIAFGRIEEITIDGTSDVLGSPIDLCSRMEKFAHNQQILIDSTLHDATLSMLKDFGMAISQGMRAILKGIGEVKLYEIASNNTMLKNRLNMPLQVHESGRLSIDEKVAFIENAKKEVLELGSGLREFTSYFERRRPAEFKEPVIELLRRGVNFKCIAIDPEVAKIYYASREPQYAKEIPETIEKLKYIRNDLKQMNLAGSFEIYTHPFFPLFHAQCIDGDDVEYGQMIVSNYVYETKRSQSPVLQFSRSSNPTMFNTYWNGIKKVISQSKSP
jgi:class 3 adenylate cyclase